MQVRFGFGDASSSVWNRLSAALFLLEEQLETIETTLSLGARIQELLQAERAVTKCFKVRDLRRNRALAKMLGFRDAPELRDDAELRMRLAPEVQARALEPSIRLEIEARTSQGKGGNRPGVASSNQRLANPPHRAIKYGGPYEIEMSLGSDAGAKKKSAPIAKVKTGGAPKKRKGRA